MTLPRLIQLFKVLLKRTLNEYKKSLRVSLNQSYIPLKLSTFPTVIETEFFILTPEQYQEHSQDADELGISIDYYLSEFCEVQGPTISTNK